jgi:hypothetical protein
MMINQMAEYFSAQGCETRRCDWLLPQAQASRQSDLKEPKVELG